MALVDLLAVLPFYLPMFLSAYNLIVLRFLRVVRILRLFKITRYTNVASTIGAVLKKKSSQLISSTFVVFLLMVITSVLMYQVENAAQPDVFTNIVDSFWWAVATITTIGYGDIYPITATGQLLNAMIAFLGIGLIAIPTGILASGFIEQANKRKQDEENEQEHSKKHFCPYCGENLD
jgi:voltage-gated potassium channel